MNYSHFTKYTSLMIVGLLAGNSFAFVLGMGPAIEHLSASSYISFHESMQRSFLAWTPYLCGILVISLTGTLIKIRKEWMSVEFILVLFALICVVEEIFMTWTGNVPLSRVIQSWRMAGAPEDWGDIRGQWLYFMYWRCALLVASFGLLLASVIATTKSESLPSQTSVAAAV